MALTSLWWGCFILFLVIPSWLDIRFRKIPVFLPIGFLALFLAFAPLGPGSFLLALVGAATGLVILAFAQAFRLTNTGDMFIGATLGAAIGFPNILLALIISLASVLMLTQIQRRTVPGIPFIAAGGLATSLYVRLI